MAVTSMWIVLSRQAYGACAELDYSYYEPHQDESNLKTVSVQAQEVEGGHRGETIPADNSLDNITITM